MSTHCMVCRLHGLQVAWLHGLQVAWLYGLHGLQVAWLYVLHGLQVAQCMGCMVAWVAEKNMTPTDTGWNNTQRTDRARSIIPVHLEEHLRPLGLRIYSWPDKEAARCLPPSYRTLIVGNVVGSMTELSEEIDSSLSSQPRSNQILRIVCLSEQPCFCFATAVAAVLGPLILPAPNWPPSSPSSPQRSV